MNRAAPAPSTILTPGLLAAIGFSDHAIERFAQRAGVTPTRRAIVEPLIRDLLLQEGTITASAPLYLQFGDCMLFVLRPGGRNPSRLVAVTAVNGPSHNDWVTALRRGRIGTPPPPRLKPLPSGRLDWRDWWRDALALRRQDNGVGLLRALRLAGAVGRGRARVRVAALSDANRELPHEVAPAGATSGVGPNARWRTASPASSRGGRPADATALRSARGRCPGAG